jgi:hypothetical protein
MVERQILTKKGSRCLSLMLFASRLVALAREFSCGREAHDTGFRRA